MLVIGGFGSGADLSHCYRNAYFTVVNLIGAGVFNFVGDRHHQRDGVLEAEAAKFDDMVERIRHVAD